MADAHSPRLNAPFTAAEERLFARTDVCNQVSFPFMSFQWKAGVNGGTMDETERQASRDGATIVNSLHQFLAITT